MRSDIRSSFGDATGTAEGVPMTLELALSDLADGGSAFAGAAVYVWHCDREGRYSMYSEGVEDQNYLRGAQVADDDGIVRFKSIFPACYAGRWPHIHFEVYPDQGASPTRPTRSPPPRSRCRRPSARRSTPRPATSSRSRTWRGLSLSSDNVFGDDGGASQLATVTGDIDDGFTVKLAVRVDTSTEPMSAGRRMTAGGRAASGQTRPTPYADQHCAHPPGRGVFR